MRTLRAVLASFAVVFVVGAVASATPAAHHETDTAVDLPAPEPSESPEVEPSPEVTDPPDPEPTEAPDAADTLEADASADALDCSGDETGLENAWCQVTGNLADHENYGLANAQEQLQANMTAQAEHEGEDAESSDEGSDDSQDSADTEDSSDDSGPGSGHGHSDEHGSSDGHGSNRD